jgi:hypothetical protein
MKNLYHKSHQSTVKRAITKNRPGEKRFLAFFLLTAVLFAAALPCKLLAQAPVISYAGPQTYTTGVTVAALSPVNTGGADETVL